MIKTAMKKKEPRTITPSSPKSIIVKPDLSKLSTKDFAKVAKETFNKRESFI